MDTTNMVLKTKLSEVLETLNLIILIYSIFLAILGIKFHNSELIIQTCIMFVVYVIFEFLNYDITYVTDKGVKSGKFKKIFWADVYRIQKNERTIYIYTKEREKPYKIIISKSEDSNEISKIYKYSSIFLIYIFNILSNFL